jgi:hypothetical protein
MKRRPDGRMMGLPLLSYYGGFERNFAALQKANGTSSLALTALEVWL